MPTTSFVAARVRVRTHQGRDLRRRGEWRPVGRRRAEVRRARTHEWRINQRREPFTDVRGPSTGGAGDFPSHVPAGRSRSPPSPAAPSAAVRSRPRHQRSDVLERKHPMRAMDVVGPAGRAGSHAGPLPFWSAASGRSSPSAMDRSRFAMSGSGRFDGRLPTGSTPKGDASAGGSTFGSHPRHRQAWHRNGRRLVSLPRQCSKTLWDLDRASLSDPHLGQCRIIASFQAAAAPTYETRVASRRVLTIWS